jgi:transcriptional regulator with XRE-family HTH domain
MQVPRTYISKIENGKAIPTLGSLERLAAALGVDVRQLVRDARSRRDEEVAAILADPLLAEIAALLPHLDSLHRTLFYGARARHGHGPPAHRVEAPGAYFVPVSACRRIAQPVQALPRSRAETAPGVNCGAWALVLGSMIETLGSRLSI